MINPDHIFYLIPSNDLEEHTEEVIFPIEGLPYCNCKCQPTYQFELDGMLVVHNSFDGRENFEYPSLVRDN